MTILDRYILRALLVNYGIGLSVMLMLYVMLDMFVNMDEFTESGLPLARVVGNIIGYYWPNLFLYFNQLSGVITLFACVATIARMRRSHELTAVLATGTSLYRVAAPILLFGAATTLLWILDTERIIPALAHKLARDHDDADGSVAYEVLFLRDRDDNLLSARQFHPARKDLRGLLVLTRDDQMNVVRTLEADKATWEPSAEAAGSGTWRLARGRQRTRFEEPGRALGPTGDFRESFPETYASDLSPRDIQLRQAENWLAFLSLRQLHAIAQKPDADLAEIGWIRNARVTAPLISIVMLLLALPFFLDRTPTTLLSDAGKCMVVCGACYVSAFVCQNIRSEANPALPFWIPIFVFATIAMVLLDRVKT